MTVSATIEVMTLSSIQGQEKAAVPAGALQHYFRSLGVNLTFQPGPAFAREQDPCRDSAVMSAFCAGRAPPQGNTNAPAILVVTEMAPEGDGTNGQLMDAARRGACAVYTDSWAFRTHGAEERFEIFVHEIGHMLNLAHREADEDFETAMAQFDDRARVNDRVQLWREAIDGAAPSYGNKLSAFFGAGNASPIGLPMSKNCCDLLADRPTSKVAPWGSNFEDDGEGTRNDVAFGRLACSLELETDQLQVAQPLEFSITLRLRPGEKAGDIPAALDLRSGNVRLELIGPDGKARSLLPDGQSCTAGRRRLRPGQIARRHYSLLGDRRGLALPKPGDYRLRAVLPALDARSDWAAFRVASAQSPLALPTVKAALRRGVAGKDRKHWDAIRQILAGQELSPATRAHLALLGVAKQLLDLQPLRAMRAIASPRIAERDAVLRIAHWQQQANVEEVHRAIDAAERLFSACDPQHATLSYLRHLRRVEYARSETTRRTR